MDVDIDNTRVHKEDRAFDQRLALLCCRLAPGLNINDLGCIAADEIDALTPILITVDRNTNGCTSQAPPPAPRSLGSSTACPVPRPSPSAASWRDTTEPTQVRGRLVPLFRLHLFAAPESRFPWTRQLVSQHSGPLQKTLVAFKAFSCHFECELLSDFTQTPCIMSVSYC